MIINFDYLCTWGSMCIRPRFLDVSRNAQHFELKERKSSMFRGYFVGNNKEEEGVVILTSLMERESKISQEIPRPVGTKVSGAAFGKKMRRQESRIWPGMFRPSLGGGSEEQFGPENRIALPPGQTAFARYHSSGINK